MALCSCLFQTWTQRGATETVRESCFITAAVSFYRAMVGCTIMSRSHESLGYQFGGWIETRRFWVIFGASSDIFRFRRNLFNAELSPTAPLWDLHFDAFLIPILFRSPTRPEPPRRNWQTMTHDHTCLVLRYWSVSKNTKNIISITSSIRFRFGIKKLWSSSSALSSSPSSSSSSPALSC